MSIEFYAGSKHCCDYPFHKDVRENYGYEGSWIPGCIAREVYDDVEMVANGMGKMLIEVVSVHRPGRFPTRVFFIRQWQDPDGKVFGKERLHCRTVGYLRARLKGYMADKWIEPFVLETETEASQ